MIFGKGFHALSLAVKKGLRHPWQKQEGNTTVIYKVSRGNQHFFKSGSCNEYLIWYQI